MLPLHHHLGVLSPTDRDASSPPGLVLVPLFAEDMCLGGSLHHIGVELVHIRAVHVVEEAETVRPWSDEGGQQAGLVVVLTGGGRFHVHVVTFVCGEEGSLLKLKASLKRITGTPIVLRSHQQ